MNKATAVDFLTILFYCAVVYLLVKPGSNGVSFIDTFTNAMAGLISAATAP